MFCNQKKLIVVSLTFLLLSANRPTHYSDSKLRLKIVYNFQIQINKNEKHIAT